MRKAINPAEADKIKQTGVCPYSTRTCDRARLCTLTVQDACLKRVLRTVSSCCVCKRRGTECSNSFKCFREKGVTA